jgi:hypothetical protein
MVGYYTSGMRKKTTTGKRALRGFLRVTLGKDWIFKCERCSKAWGVAIPSSGKVADIERLTTYNLDLHRRAHAGDLVNKSATEFKRRQLALRLKARNRASRRKPARRKVAKPPVQEAAAS